MKLIIAALVFLSVPFAGASTKSQIAELLRLNRISLQNSNASEAQLDEAADHLQAALDILDGGSSGGDSDPGHPGSVCMSWALTEFKNAGYGAQDAMDRASNACRSTQDLQIMKFAYNELKNAGYGVQDAMARASNFSNSGVEGKWQIFSYGYTEYKNAGYGVQDSLDRALNLAKSLPRSGFGCLDLAYKNFKNSGYGVQDSFNRAINACK